MSEINQLKDEFKSKRDEIKKTNEDNKRQALEDYQKQVDQLNIDYFGRTDSDEYLKLKEQYKEDYHSSVEEIDNTFQNKLNDINEKEETLLKYFDNDYTKEINIQTPNENHFINPSSYHQDVEYDEHIQQLRDKEVNAIQEDTYNAIMKAKAKCEEDIEHAKEVQKNNVYLIEQEREDLIRHLEVEYANDEAALKQHIAQANEDYYMKLNENNYTYNQNVLQEAN